MVNLIIDTVTGTAISPNGTRYAMNGVTDISGSPVWQQIGKQGSLTEQYYVFANNIVLLLFLSKINFDIFTKTKKG